MDELDLNRFRKQGGELVLEEYSHCEVPAGCGGIVLRWVRATDPCALELSTLGRDARATINGAVLASRRVTVPLGEHVLTLAVDDASFFAHLRLTHRRVSRASLSSAADGSWRGTRVAPPAAWTDRDFDDSSWAPLIEVARPTPADRVEAWRVETLAKAGAQALGAPGTGWLWARRVFVLDTDGLR